jgi:WhiB family redox-sensing transcriptional regulator
MSLIPERARPAFVELAEVIALYGPVACETSTDPDAWWPAKGEASEQATAACRRCPAQPECLDYALVARETDGCWGGTTPAERRLLIASDQ